MIEDTEHTVYKHTTPNGKVYIGITGRKPEKRWENGKGYKNNKYFYRAILKYGWENIEHDVLYDGLTKEQACNKEIELIAKYDATNPKHGYNNTMGGEANIPSKETRRKMSNAHKGVKLSKQHILKRSIAQKGLKRSEETKKKLSKSLKGKQSVWKGKHLPEETRRKISESNKGKHLSAETRRKIGEASKGRPSPLKGKHLSAETRLKLSEANKGKIPWNKGIKGQIPWNKGKHLSPEIRWKVSESLKGKTTKAVICVETGTLYSSVTEAAKSIGIAKSNISAVCRHRIEKAGGYHWKYVEEQS